MAAACPSSDSADECEDPEPDCQHSPCKYYNSGGCRDGSCCLYLHVCMYAFNGNCRYGNRCKLDHSVGESSPAPKLTDDRPYQWQLNAGGSWMDVSNDHIIEAQYSLPHRKSIKIYNTQYGAVSVDFTKMRVEGKNLTVRRLDDGNTEWVWFSMLSSKWVEYGEKDCNGCASSVTSSDIEEKFQNDPTGSLTVNHGSLTFYISFRDMQQLSQNRVTRRPRYRQKTTSGLGGLCATFQQILRQPEPQWQFEGDRVGAWHDFKNRGSCTMSSDDIEVRFQQNPQDSMTFTVWGQSYKLDLNAMTQTNLKTRNVRRVRRVLR